MTRKRNPNNTDILPRSQSQEDAFNNDDDGVFEFELGDRNYYNQGQNNIKKQLHKPDVFNSKESSEKIAANILNSSTVVGFEETNYFKVEFDGKDLYQAFDNALIDKEYYQIKQLGLVNNKSANDPISVNYQHYLKFGNSMYRRGYAHTAIAACDDIEELDIVLNILIEIGIDLNTAGDCGKGPNCLDIAKERGQTYVDLVTQKIKFQNSPKPITCDNDFLKNKNEFLQNILNKKHKPSQALTP